MPLHAAHTQHTRESRTNMNAFSICSMIRMHMWHLHLHVSFELPSSAHTYTHICPQTHLHTALQNICTCMNACNHAYNDTCAAQPKFQEQYLVYHKILTHIHTYTQCTCKKQAQCTYRYTEHIQSIQIINVRIDTVT
jgi:hypothetical protein